MVTTCMFGARFLEPLSILLTTRPVVQRMQGTARIRDKRNFYSGGHLEDYHYVTVVRTRYGIFFFSAIKKTRVQSSE